MYNNVDIKKIFLLGFLHRMGCTDPTALTRYTTVYSSQPRCVHDNSALFRKQPPPRECDKGKKSGLQLLNCDRGGHAVRRIRKSRERAD